MKDVPPTPWMYASPVLVSEIDQPLYDNVHVAKAIELKREREELRSEVEELKSRLAEEYKKQERARQERAKALEMNSEVREL